MAKGMIQPFEVVEDTAGEVDLDAADGTVTAKGSSYATTYEAKAGEQVIELENAGSLGPRDHAVVLRARQGPGRPRRRGPDAAKGTVLPIEVT